MKGLAFTLIHLCFAMILFAQPPVGIKGRFIDSIKNTPVELVNMTVSDPAQQKTGRNLQSKLDGSFELTGLQAGKTYHLRCSLVGYQPRSIVFKTSGGISDMGDIKLTAAVGQLKEVTVSASRPTIKQEIDRTIYNVQADPDVKALDMLDIMRKVPLLSVDANDKIELKGSTNYKILINDKESAMLAHSPADALRSMPATTIERIEVITNPPVKYDAEGLAGIINIVTRSKGPQGYNGTLNGRWDNVYGPQAGLNFTYVHHQLGLTLYDGYGDNGHYPTSFDNTQVFTANKNMLIQQGNRMNGNQSYFSGGQVSFEPDTLNLLTAELRYFHNHVVTDNDQYTQQFSAPGMAIQQYELRNTGTNNSNGIDVNINYQLGFRRSKDQLLTFSYLFSNPLFRQYTNGLYSNELNFPQSNFMQHNSSGSTMNTLQLDYAHPFSKFFLMETGVKGIFRNNFSDFNTALQDQPAGPYTGDPAQTNDFTYQQRVYSAYNSYQIKHNNWAAKAGLRLEHTTVNADFASTNTLFHTGYNNLIPSVALQHIFKQHSINLGFTQRIQRPAIAQLNPFVDESNPKFITTGNPDLKSQLSNSFELNYSHSGTNSVTTGINYSFSNNAIQGLSSTVIQTLNGQPDTVTQTTYANYGSNRSLNYNLSANLTLTKGLTFNASGQLIRMWLKGTYQGRSYTNGGYLGRLSGNLGYSPDNDFRAAFNISYSSGNIGLQDHTGYAIANQFVFSKNFLSKKLALSALVNGPQARYNNYYSYTTTPDYNSVYHSDNLYRHFALRFNYKLGKLSTDIKKNQHGINNDDQGGNARPANN